MFDAISSDRATNASTWHIRALAFYSTWRKKPKTACISMLEAWQEALPDAKIELSVWRIHRRIGMSGGLSTEMPCEEVESR